MGKHKSFTNKEIARLLRTVAAAYEIKDKDRFRVVAYEEAATSVEHATSEVKDLWDDGKLVALADLPGVGKGIASHLDELFKTGRVKHFEQVLKGLPTGMFPLLDLPGLGAKTAFKLAKKFKLEGSDSIAQLEKVAKMGKIAKIPHFGGKSQEKILESIRVYKETRSKQARMNLPFADEIAQEIISYLKKSPEAIRVDALGSLRRRVATIGDIDLAVATRKPNKVIDYFIKYPKAEKVLEKGEDGASIRLKNKRQIDLRVESPQPYGALLQHLTGSKQHNIHLREIALKKGFSLSEYGIKRLKDKDKGKIQEFASEEVFYKALGLEWIPPEIREETGEIEASQKGKLPHLVELSDIKGDLHVHSSFDVQPSHDQGLDSMEEMIKTAEKLGYEYLGFSEHNPSTSNHSDKEFVKILKKKREKVDQISKLVSEDINYSRGKKLLVRALNSLEIDIKPDGKLAIPQEGIKTLDYAIVSIHTSFSMNKEEMTKRVLAGLSNPIAKIFGHPTGRKLNLREGYELDWEKIFVFCLKNKKWLEINAWPERLDLPDSLVREAVKRGVKIIINTDAHQVSQMALMPYGVSVARRGWAQKEDIINSLSYNNFVKALKEGR